MRPPVFLRRNRCTVFDLRVPRCMQATQADTGRGFPLERLGLRPFPPPAERIHFVGIGGAGMSGLAHVCLDLHACVTGSDPAQNRVVRRLAMRGARVFPRHAPENIGDAELLVYSSAIPDDNPELEEARRRGLSCVPRGRFLADLATRFRTVVAVAGSHGKTTTTAAIAHILRRCGLRPGWIIGGEPLGAEPATAGGGRFFVTEVDESDGSQAWMRAALGVILNIDDDHAWSLGGRPRLEQCFREFAANCERVICPDAPFCRRILAGLDNLEIIDPAVPDDIRAVLQLPGEHNLLNAAVAVHAAVLLGTPRAEAVAALADFRGVQRRLQVRFRSPNGAAVVVEDYAHHPAELQASLAALRRRWPEHRLVVVFQPHRHERVRRYAVRFARLLAGADSAYVRPTFGAWLADGSPHTAAKIAEFAGNSSVQYSSDPDATLAERLTSRLLEDGLKGVQTLVAVIGAGDISRFCDCLTRYLADAWTEQLRSALHESLPDLRAERSKRWSDLTSARIGKDRPLVAEPATTSQLRALLAWCDAHNVPVLALGNGTNVIGTDNEPVRIVIRLHRGEFAAWERMSNGLVRSGAGVSLTALWRTLINEEAMPPDLAVLGWIPGSVGGAVATNAGADGVSLGQCVEHLEGVTLDGRRWSAAGRDLRWGYRRSGIPADVVVTQVTLRLAAGAAAAARDRFEAAGHRRAARLPACSSAGSTFRNAGEARAGRILDRLGCKGLTVGGCRVSRRHANVICTSTGASESDFLQLVLTLQRRAWDYSGLVFKSEVRFAGPAAQAECVRRLRTPHVALLVQERCETASAAARCVAQWLKDAGYHVEHMSWDVQSPPPPLSPEIDAVYPILQDVPIEEAFRSLQRLANLGVPVVGADIRPEAVPRAENLAERHGKSDFIECIALAGRVLRTTPRQEKARPALIRYLARTSAVIARTAILRFRAVRGASGRLGLCNVLVTTAPTPDHRAVAAAVEAGLSPPEVCARLVRSVLPG